MANRQLRQIVTRAVIAKGKKRTESKEKLKPANSPSNILGCWVINHHYSAKKHGKYVEVQGKFDVNVWYSYQNQSKTGVHSETINYKDRIKLHYRDKDDVRESNDVQVKVLQHPNCIEATIASSGDCFDALIEREFLVEVIGETTVVISVHPNEYEEEWRFEESSSSTRRNNEVNHDESSLLEDESSSLI